MNFVETKFISYLFFTQILISTTLSRYEPTWKSLDTRPLPEWYDDAKVGIFLHWGIFSVPSYKSEWFWYYWKTQDPRISKIGKYMNTFYSPNFAYSNFVENFRAEFFDPNSWAELFEQSGARYVVLTTKHHEGFCLWPSTSAWEWNSMDVGPQKDLVGELANAIKSKTKLHFGAYYSLFEWFNPLYLNDQSQKFKTQNFVQNKVMPELMDLVMKYKPDIIWADGCYGPDTYWNSTQFIAWLYNDSPVKDTVVTNDRWCLGCECHHGDFFNCFDRFHPGKLMLHKWENCMTLDRGAWGYRREMILSDIFTPEELIKELIETVAFGGNILINVAPTSWGTIDPIFEERLHQLGSWLRINGDAIYNTRPWRIQKEFANTWYTTMKNSSDGNNDGNIKNAVYCILTKWPEKRCSNQTKLCRVEVLLLSVIAHSKDSHFILLDGTAKGKSLEYVVIEEGKPGVIIRLCTDGNCPPDGLQWAWTIKMLNVE